MDKIFAAVQNLDQAIKMLNEAYATFERLKTLNDALHSFVEKVRADKELLRNLSITFTLLEYIVKRRGEWGSELAELRVEAFGVPAEDIVDGWKYMEINEFFIPADDHFMSFSLAEVSSVWSTGETLDMLHVRGGGVRWIYDWLKKNVYAACTLVVNGRAVLLIVPKSNMIDLKCRASKYEELRRVLAVGTLNTILCLETLSRFAKLAVSKLGTLKILEKITPSTTETMTKLS